MTKGEKIAALLGFREYERLLKIAEEYEDIKDFDECMSDPEWESFEDVTRRFGVLLTG